MKLVLSLALVLAACGSKKPTDAPTNTTTTEGSATGGSVQDAPMTPEACTGQGGEVRGDIGDGKIACAPGERDLGRVNQGIEGAVCCAPGATP